jgi:SAM-dependent methyltransferase
MSQTRYSYSSTKIGFFARTNEILKLITVSLRAPTTGVAFTVGTMQNVEKRVLEVTGLRLQDLKILEIGPGQQLRHLRYFALHNDAVGIDTDIIPQGLQIKDYLRMLRHSPPMRSLKTLGRKMLGRDARYAAALAKALGVERFPPIPVQRMSATAMTFPDASFDFAFSFSVFEHIDDPGVAIREVVRVLRPGGVAYISLHLYTSHSGGHDPTIFAAGKPVPPLWPHLRPQFEHLAHASAHLNRISLKEWREIFERIMPGAHLVNERQDDEIGDGLKELRAKGELSTYTDEELMTVNLVAIWKKPASTIRAS